MSNHVTERNRCVFIRGPPISVQAEGCDAAGVDHAFDPGSQCGLHNAACPLDITLIQIIGVARPQAVIGGDMVQTVATSAGTGERIRVAQIAMKNLHREILDVTVVAMGAG